MNKVKNPIIIHQDKCTGCNKYILVYHILGTNISVIENNINKIYVDEKRCIECGKCIEVCEHGIRDFTDDTQTFFKT